MFLIRRTLPVCHYALLSSAYYSGLDRPIRRFAGNSSDVQ